MKVSGFFAWYDLWVGAFWDREKRILYICPLPCLAIKIETIKEAIKTAGEVGK